MKSSRIGSDGILEHLSLHKQMLSGTIPTEFGLATSLCTSHVVCHVCSDLALKSAHIAFLSLPRDTAEVALFDNFLSGTVPTELSGLPLLGRLFR